MVDSIQLMLALLLRLLLSFGSSLGFHDGWISMNGDWKPQNRGYHRLQVDNFDEREVRMDTG